MAINPCQIITKCDCQPGVFRTNFSAEQPDPAEFFAIEFEQFVPHLGDPDTFWTNIAQPGVCLALTLQEAQDCARRSANDAIVQDWRDPHRNPVVLFGNAAQSCSIPCPTGPPFIYTVEAGTFTARTQEEADTIAASYCFSRGLKARQCNPPIVPPSIEVVNLIQLWDLSDNGNLVGVTPTGEAGWFNNGGVTQLSFAGGAALNANLLGDIGGSFNVGPNQDAFWYDGILRDLGFGVSGFCSMHGMSDDGFSVFFDSAPGVQSSLYNPITSTFTSLGFAGGGSFTQPGAPFFSSPIPQRRVINTSHQVCGYYQDAINDRHAFRWSGVLVDITPPAGQPNPFAGSLCIDNTGAVMGEYQVTASTTLRGFLNLGGAAVNSLDIGGVGTRTVEPVSMSAQNQIICGVCDDGGGPYPATARAFRWNSVEGFKLINRLVGATVAFMGDCNSHGDIVGYDDTSNGWIFRNGVVYKLIDILNAWGTDPLWTAITDAELCNDDRQIAGFGIHSGVNKAYLLTLPAGTELGPPPP